MDLDLNPADFQLYNVFLFDLDIINSTSPDSDWI